MDDVKSIFIPFACLACLKVGVVFLDKLVSVLLPFEILCLLAVLFISLADFFVTFKEKDLPPSLRLLG